MARRQLDDDDAFAAAYFARKGEDPLSQAMQLLKFQQGGEEAAANRAFQERSALAEEMWRKGQLEAGQQQEQRLTSAAEESKRQYETGEATRQRERGEDIALKKEEKTLASSEKEKDRLAREREHQVDIVKELYPEGSPERKKRLETLDPEYAKIAQGIAAEKLTSDVAANLEKFKNASPKQRAAYKIDPGAIGGKEALAELERRVAGEEAAAAPRPDLAPQVGAPLVSAVGQGGVWQHQIPQAANFPRSAQAIPAVAGVTEPIPLPRVQTPAPAGPSFMDLIMAKLEDARQREAMEPKRERYPDLGTVPLPVGQLPPQLLAQPATRPLGVR